MTFQSLIRRTITVIVFACCLEPWDARSQGPPTVQEVIQGAEQTERLLFDNDSLYLRYERTSSVDLIPSRASGGQLPVEIVIGYRHKKWYSQRRFTRPFKTKSFTVPAQPAIQIVREGVRLNWDRENNAATLFDFQEGSGGDIYSNLLYTRNLSLDLPKRVAESQGTALKAARRSRPGHTDLPFLPEFLIQNRRHYEVRPDPEVVNGTRCWVIEWPQMDRIWVDPTRGFAIVRRVFANGPGEPLRFEFSNRDYREVKSGLWLPFAQVEDKYADIRAEAQALWGKSVARSEYRLHEIKIDTLDDNFFEVKLPPGTRVSDTVRKIMYTVSDEPEPMAAAIEQSKADLHAAALVYWAKVAGACAAGLLALVASVFLYRNRVFGLLRRG